MLWRLLWSRLQLLSQDGRLGTTGSPLCVQHLMSLIPRLHFHNVSRWSSSCLLDYTRSSSTRTTVVVLTWERTRPTTATTTTTTTTVIRAACWVVRGRCTAVRF